MTYLTHDHAPPPTHVLADGLRHPVAPLIRREDIHRLSALGVLRHITADGPAPLGYTPWQLAEDAQGPHYWRGPAGTPEEIQAAAEAQAAAERDAYLDGLECTDLQAELELIARDLWDSVQAWIDLQDPATQAYFRRAKSWKYRDPRLQAGAAAMGMSDAQLIEILESARTLWPTPHVPETDFRNI